ncbi:hypothetical protein [Streptomyces sp. NBC_01244]|uniref:hypothetical protein n=1 Tax=Streptomyces sp. NBC_01244 TaxID=2903797 RepID=UPI002E15E450|nr:hypothetical protein OG247_38230 [Streptomyces sp. NBC_01244]
MEREKYRKEGWWALRSAGLSRKEVESMYSHHKGEILDSTGEQRRAHQASYDAKAAAWETLRTSPYASALGVTGHAPQETGALGEKLGEIRERVAQVAQRLDDSHQQDAARLTGNAVKAGEKAVEWSSHLRLAQAEQGQRVEIASKFPRLHQQETAARTVEQQKEQAAAATERARKRSQAANYDSYTDHYLNGPDLSGPSMSR